MRQLDNNITLRFATNAPSADRVVSVPFEPNGSSTTYGATTNWIDARGNTWRVAEHNTNERGVRNDPGRGAARFVAVMQQLILHRENT